MNGCDPFKWAWGLVPVILVALIVIAGEGPKIEQDLTRKAASALQASGHGWADIKFDGRQGILKGTVGTPEERNEAVRVVSDLRGVGKVQDRANLLPVVKPYTWWATREGTRVKVKGHVPTQADRQTILGIVKATMPELEIDDRMKLATGMADKQQWLGAVSFALSQLGHLKDGSARLTDLGLDVTGEASSEADFIAVRNALSAQMPAGLTLTKYQVTPPQIKPYAWAVEVRAGTVKLTGHVPSDAMRRDFLQKAKKLFPGTTIEDGMTLGSGAPEGWTGVVSVSFTQLARLDEGRVTVKGDQLAIEGVAPDETTAADVAKSVRGGLPASFKSVEKIDSRKAPEPADSPKTEPAAKPEKTMVTPPRKSAERSRTILPGSRTVAAARGALAAGSDS